MSIGENIRVDHDSFHWVSRSERRYDARAIFRDDTSIFEDARSKFMSIDCNICFMLRDELL